MREHEEHHGHREHEHHGAHKARGGHAEHEGRHMRRHRETGGVNEAEEDLATKPEARTNASIIDRAAEERKHGGETKKKRVKRAHGGEIHHSRCRCEKCMGGETKREHRAKGGMILEPGHQGHGHGPDEHMGTHRKMRSHGGKEVGEVHGERHRAHAGHKPRKSGGRSGSDEHPFSSAKAGTPAPGRKVQTWAED